MSFQITACITIKEMVSGYENGDRFNKTRLSSDMEIFHTFSEKPSIIMEYALLFSKIDYNRLFATQISWPGPKIKGRE